MYSKSIISKLYLSLYIVLFSAQLLYSQNNTIDSLQKIYNIHIKEDKKRVDVLNELSYYMYSYNISKAKQYALEALNISLKINYLEGESESYNNIGITYSKVDRNKAYGYFKKALSIANKMNLSKTQIKALLRIGNIKLDMGENNYSDSCYTQAYNLALTGDDDALIGEVLLSMSCLKRLNGNIVKCIQDIDKAEKYIKNANDNYLLSRVYVNSGIAYQHIGNQTKSLENYLKAVDILKQTGEQKLLISTYVNIGGLHYSYREYKSSLEMIFKGLDIAKEINDSTQIAVCLSRLGNVFISMNDPKGLNYLIESLKYINENSNQSIHALLSIAGFYSTRKEYKMAQLYLDKAIIIAEKLKNPIIFSRIWNQISVLKYYQKKYKDAIYYANKTKTIADRTKDNEMRKSVYGVLSESNAELKNYKEAYNYLGKWKMLSDSIINANNIRNIAMIESNFNHDKEIQRYEAESINNDLRIKHQRLIIVFISLIAILSSLVLGYFYRSSNLKKRLLKLQVEQGDKEIAAATLKLMQSYEKDNHCVKLIEDLEMKVSGDDKDAVRTLMSHYRRKTDDSNWTEFEILFKKVSPEFYDKLNDMFPNLTPNERKLCVFLKLNMNNKDIAKVTFQSEEALKKARLRLRRKMELDRDINLTSYIQAI